MAAIAQRQRLRPLDWYWLGRSEGFSVHSRDGRFGTVYGVRVDPGTGELVAVRVRTGLVRGEIVEVPVDAVLAVEPRRRCLFIRDAGEAFREA